MKINGNKPTKSPRSSLSTKFLTSGSVLFAGCLALTLFVTYKIYSLVGRSKECDSNPGICETELANLEAWALISRYGSLIGLALVVIGIVLLFTNKNPKETK